MNYYRLLKLLYIADRRSLQKIGRPVIGGRTVAMDRGPLHSTMCDLIKGSDPESPGWFLNFRTDAYEVEMVQDPGNGELSRYEIDLLTSITAEFMQDDEWAVGEKTHEYAEFIENKPPKGSCRTIPLASIVRAIGRADNWEAIERDATEVAVFDQVFGR